MKLTSDFLLYQLLTQSLPGCDHEGEALGPPLLDARLHARRSDGVDDQPAERYPAARGAEPPERIQEADPLYADVLAHGGVPHDHADQVVDHGKDGQFLQDTWHRLTVQYLHPHRGLKLRESGFNVIVATHNTIDLVVQTQVYKLKREMRTGSRS
jgi:hypothetical protein